jgi:hypothetical protein
MKVRSIRRYGIAHGRLRYEDKGKERSIWRFGSTHLSRRDREKEMRRLRRRRATPLEVPSDLSLTPLTPFTLLPLLLVMQLSKARFCGQQKVEKLWVSTVMISKRDPWSVLCCETPEADVNCVGSCIPSLENLCLLLSAPFERCMICFLFNRWYDGRSKVVCGFVDVQAKIFLRSSLAMSSKKAVASHIHLFGRAIENREATVMPLPALSRGL